VDGILKDLQDVSYLLSPQDLMAVSHVPELILAGVGCFKIEGRLKGPEYVALTTQVCVCMCVCLTTGCACVHVCAYPLRKTCPMHHHHRALAAQFGGHLFHYVDP